MTLNVSDHCGKIIRDIKIDNERLTLTFDDGALILTDNGQSCCEYRFMSTDDPIDYYKGLVFMGAEVADGPDEPNEWGEHETQFLIVNTALGSFTVVNHNEHNGYYGGFSIEASFEPLPTEVTP
jgi:hypothetical protein